MITFLQKNMLNLNVFEPSIKVNGSFDVLMFDNNFTRPYDNNQQIADFK